MQESNIIIKVCGMRDGDNIRLVEHAHPDMMGFICWEGSKRNVCQVPSYMPSCRRVGVFVNPTLEHVRQWAGLLRLDYIQLHGQESADMCRAIRETTGRKVIKAISISDAHDIECAEEYADVADTLLFDTKCPGKGGSGVKFDWDILRHYTGAKPFLLSGGIGPGDWCEVLSWKHPQCIGIDINSRFESAPAIKDANAIDTFIRNIRNHE